MNKVINTKDFNVVGSSNGLVVIFNRKDIIQFPESIVFKDNGLKLLFYHDVKFSKNENIKLFLMEIPCRKAVLLSCENRKEEIDCVFIVTHGESECKMKSYIIKNTISIG